jgi:hypothetical protein
VGAATSVHWLLWAARRFEPVGRGAPPQQEGSWPLVARELWVAGRQIVMGPGVGLFPDPIPRFPRNLSHEGGAEHHESLCTRKRNVFFARNYARLVCRGIRGAIIWLEQGTVGAISCATKNLPASSGAGKKPVLRSAYEAATA